jgi:hypothetical protein
MDEVLMLRGTVGLCDACGDERILLPVDDDGFELCCTDCDSAVVLVQLTRADWADPADRADSTAWADVRLAG